MSVHVLILAAGKGVRMEANVPKPLVSVAGKPMVTHLLETVKQCDFLLPPVIVVAKDSLVPAALGDAYQYVAQEEQGGTGHAVACAREILQGKSDYILVLYSDQPFIKPATLQGIVERHIQEKAMVTLATFVVPDFTGYWRLFQEFGRIIRDSQGELQAIVEYKDATEAQRAMREVNTSFFCFYSSWLWENIGKLQPSPATGERYLTDMVGIARRQGQKAATYQITNPVEAIGISRKEDVRVAEELLMSEDG